MISIHSTGTLIYFVLFYLYYLYSNRYIQTKLPFKYPEFATLTISLQLQFTYTLIYNNTPSIWLLMVYWGEIIWHNKILKTSTQLRHEYCLIVSLCCLFALHTLLNIHIWISYKNFQSKQVPSIKTACLIIYEI